MTSCVTTVSTSVLEALCCGEVESVTVMVTLLVPAAVGMPDMTPVPALMVKPAGSPLAAQEYGCVPPAASASAAYDVPVIPIGNDAVVIESPELITSDSVFVAVRTVGVELSVTVIVTEAEPAAVGVPVICPVEALMARPAGNPAADHEYGGTPPVALTVAL
jgi:hypothetical protein